MKPYPQYKDSGIEWIGEIPDSYEIKKLKFVAKANPSNIDKKSKENEESVLLCNYVDVYKNEYISKNLAFMKATASNDQIEKFKLQRDDVLATKDSESPDDIGNPALVNENLDNVVCAYHLTHIKPKHINGRYLFRYLQSKYIQSYFEVSANGITRYGLGVDKFNSALIINPPIKEQQQIASYLDHKTTKIDTLIGKKKKLIDLLKEEQTAVINEAVTKGLDPDVKMKDSGIEWLGEIPVHWYFCPLKYVTNKIIDGTHFTPTYVEDGIPFLRVTDIHSNTIDLESVKRIPKSEHEELIKRCYPKTNDLLLSKNGTIGITKIIDWDWDFSIFVSLCLIKFRLNILLPQYFTYIFQSNIADEQISVSSKKTSVTNLHLDKIRELFFLIPPIHEQQEIAKCLDKETSRIDTIITKTEKQIELLQEYRTALISEVVTGKIDIRDWKEPEK